MEQEDREGGDMAALPRRLRRPRCTRLLPAALLFILSICSMAGCGGGNNSTPTVLTATGTGVAIVQSTATAVANRRIPTATRAPTRAPAWTAAEQAYLDKVGQWGDRYVRDFSKLGDLLASPNPLDSGWTSELNNALTDLDALNNEVLNYPAPARFAELHRSLTKAAGNSEKGSDLLAEGITEFDLGKIEQGAREIEKGGTMVLQAVDDVQRLVP